MAGYLKIFEKTAIICTNVTHHINSPPGIHSLIYHEKHADTTNENPFWTLSAILSTDHNKAFGQIFNYSAIFSSIHPPVFRVHLLCLIFLKGMAFPKIIRPSCSADNRFRFEGKAFLPFIRLESKHFLIKRTRIFVNKIYADWLRSVFASNLSAQ